jgi:hypothetical protein
MKVFVLIEEFHLDYQGSSKTILGVFSTEEKAQEESKERLSSMSDDPFYKRHTSHDIEEFEVV